jgi:Flp pilus assembly protein TadG
LAKAVFGGGGSRVDLARVQALLRDRRAGIAVTFAIAVPALMMLACGAIELTSLSAEHSAMQDAADATALAMVKQLDVATASADLIINSNYASSFVPVPNGVGASHADSAAALKR